jgi:hypothetical protein
MIRPVSGTPSSGSRVLPRDVFELKALAERQPELAPAAALQVDLIEAIRRVQSRITSPWIETSTDALTERLAHGQPLLDFSQIAFDWNDVRLLVRQVTDVLRRHEVIDAATAVALHSVGRGPSLPDVMRGWFELQPALDIEMPAKSSAGRRARIAAHRRSPATARQPRRLDAPCLPGMRRGAGIPRWSRPRRRQLVCGRCHVRWGYNAIACPYCGNDDRTRIKSMATPDGVYRVMICSPCGRYIKALDARKATRPLLPYVDLIATLPLDAAVMSKNQ